LGEFEAGVCCSMLPNNSLDCRTHRIGDGPVVFCETERMVGREIRG
jgi:hypothetical protein